MPLPDGWRRIKPGEPGYSRSARTYYDSEGRIRSRRAADNERLRASGWRNKRDFDTRMTNPKRNRGYARWADFAFTHDIPNAELNRSDSEFNRLFLDFRADPNNTAPDGPLAIFLTYIGLREPEWTWDVGDTPVS